MKHALLLISGLIISMAAMAQSTWVQRLYYRDEGDFGDADSTIGIIQIAIANDDDLYILARTDRYTKEGLFKISPDDSAIKWSIQVGGLSGITGSYTNNIYPTADAGCVISYNIWDNFNLYETKGIFEKYSKDGVLEWSHQFNPHVESFPYYDMEAFYILQNEFYGTYYVFVGDSVYELNNSGNIISKLDTVEKIYTKPNGDLILQTVNGVYCTDTAGNIHWSLPGDSVLASFPSYIFVTTGSNYQKINSSNGSVIWSISIWSIPFSKISSVEYTSDGGVIGSCGLRPAGASSLLGGDTLGTLFKLDSSGTMVWVKTYNFPHYGLSYVKQLTSGYIATGGAFIFTDSYYDWFVRNYGAFVALLDSEGNGKLKTTTLMWPGDANNNGHLSFVDDALYVMVAMGDKGPKRDTLSGFGLCPYMNCGQWSDYGSDWPDTLATGLNCKYADFNGDGVIDTNDLNLYRDIAFDYSPTIQSWRMSNPFNRVASNPDFKLLRQYDSIPAGDSINFFIVAGSVAVPVDSIYGLSFSVYGHYLSDSACVREPVVTFKNSTLGTLGTNLYTYSTQGTSPYCFSNNTLISRTDHQNVYNLNDTLGIVTLYSDSTHVTDSLILNILEFNALTAGGSVVSFNYSDGSVFVYNRFTAVNEINKEYLKVYPNPSSHILTVNTSTVNHKKFVVYNSLGKLVKEFESPDAVVSIQTEELTNGVYELLVTTDAWSQNVAFVVEH